MALSNIVFEILAKFTDDGDASGAIWAGGVAPFIDYKKTFVDGTSSNQADVGTVLSYSIAAAGTQLVVINDALVSEISGTLTIAEVVGIVFVNNATAAGDDFIVACDASNGFATGFFGAAGDHFVLGPGGIAAFLNPIDGTPLAGRSDLRLTASMSRAAQ